MKAKQTFQLIVTMLVTFIVGTSATMAKNWNYSREAVADEGGGTYDFRYDQKNFRYDNKTHWNAEEHIMYFKTQKKFDAPKGSYYYEFEVGGCFIEIAKYGESEWTKTFIEGEVLSSPPTAPSTMWANGRSQSRTRRRLSIHPMTTTMASSTSAV